MFHATLALLTLICFMLVAGPLLAADRLVDGVPLPEDAKTATVAETGPMNFDSGREPGSAPWLPPSEQSAFTGITALKRSRPSKRMCC